MSNWAKWYEKADRHVAETEKEGAQVSTILLGLDRSFGGERPLLFETMIFGGDHDGDHKTMKRVKAKQVSWRNAVNEKCKECIYDEYGEGTWKAQVENCTMPDCPLYTIRPVTEETRRNRAQVYQNEAVSDN